MTSPANTKNIDVVIKEQTLRSEIQHCRELVISIMRWGVTVLIGMETSLWFMRMHVTEHLAKLDNLQADETIPFVRWLFGTVFMLIVACVFYAITRYVGLKLRDYRRQLLDMKGESITGIEEVQGASSTLRFTIYGLYFIFPLIDLIIYPLIQATRWRITI